MAAALVETPSTIEDRQIHAAEMFYERVGFHFDTLWHALNDKEKTTAVILSLMELGGRSAGNRFAYEDIENVSAFDYELRHLASLGLAEKVKDGWAIDLNHGLLWRGDEWTIGAQAFTWWVRDIVISESRELKEYDEWLADKKYRMFLTEEEWNWLTNLVKSTPDFLKKGIATLAKSLFEEFAGINLSAIK